ncbi:piggyBac transposable element-derived protein 4-like [Mytilus californianus]|uniref:piggyBac transposable element-derived protein 4-like n=1 Tax=Mytilus californianus TaxID=6549 RepID=UPI0022457ABB|nr:piggyBac transposable element-derived protein 4-like [Mytilus californianus]
MEIFLSSQSSQFSGFGLSDLEDENDSPGSVSPPSSVRTSDLSSDEESEVASDLSDRNPDSDIEEDDDELPDSDGEFESQLSEIPSSQLTSVSDDDFWSEQLEDIEIPDFNEVTGPVHMLPLNAQAVDFFQLFFEERFFQHLSEQTNLYAEQTSENDQHWEEVTTDEIKAFIGINILMGVMQLASYRLYWSSDPFLGNTGIRSVMTENRFSKLYQYIHVNNNQTAVPRDTEGFDKLHKVRPIINMVDHTFKDHYKPKQNQTVDEAMVKYKGRFSIKQYMPGKPIKRGMKVWMRADSTSGYCHQFNVYMGKDDPNKGPKLGEKVVKLLCKDLKWKGHHIYMDRYFTSVPLFRCLERNGIYGCGTIKCTAVGLPEDITDPPRMARGESIARQNGNLVATVWQDKKKVHFLSTNSNPTGEGSTFRRLKNGTRIEINRSPPVEGYHNYMGGVDRNNQLRAKTPVGRPAKKWWKYLFFYIINLCITNAFIVMNESVGYQPRKKRYSLLDFRIDIAKQLIGNFTKRNRRIVNQQPNNNHVSVRLNRTKRRCKWCTKQGEKKRKETVYGCSNCNIHLCRESCFEHYHQQHGLPFAI